MTEEREQRIIKVESLASGGEGVFTEEGKKYYIPYALEGEIVKACASQNKKKKDHLELLEVVEASEDRIEAFCKYFTSCGGCSVQHLKKEKYISWKESLLKNALSHNGFNDVNIKDLAIVEKGHRRRISISYENFKDNIKLGFYQKSSNRIVDIDICPLLNKELNNILAPLKELLKEITTPRDSGHFVVTSTDSGLDISFCPRKKIPLDPPLLEKFSIFAAKHNIAQITRAGKELILLNRHPEVKFLDSFVEFPSNAFLQPSKKGEQLMLEEVNRIVAGIESKKELEIGDLCCGLGTFSIPLTIYGKVTAFDVYGPSIKSLKKLEYKNLSVEERDLYRSPLQKEELERFDVVIMDPPRSGAESQSIEIANSSLKNLIYISCHTGTFARDAKILREGGFSLEEVLPIDQFPASSHLEVIGVFRKG